jgi:hypothetical protein
MINAPHQERPIPKEIVCIPRSTVDHRSDEVALHEVDEKTGKYGSRHRSRHHATCATSAANRTKRLDHLTTERLCMPSRTCFQQNRRRESLRSVSREACVEAQKFLETKHKDILLEYSTEEDGNSIYRSVRNENELSLSELAGLLSVKLGDAIERGLFTVENPAAARRYPRIWLKKLETIR